MKPSNSSRRSRGRANGKRQGKNTNFDSNGPDVRVRGNAHQVLEKYLTLARDAQSAGDRISSENYLQHAEHYYRILHANDGPNERDGQRGQRVRTPEEDAQEGPSENDLVRATDEETPRIRRDNGNGSDPEAAQAPAETAEDATEDDGIAQVEPEVA